ncbi:MAG: helix-turn-helix domain-containing protein [Cytophagaceae bacterium]|nr:helix-turn-helix domain-containing protein [Cytophagaceae bacterium]MBK9934838.1 helix-turn-helix domain-containing protein [Cytophagaceae bacterium]MBL0301276.1 helix-turn-helix domain-containing protein [Cytophagaceae bacterium]MBL0324093.1 helix-turn-helix domain-containing protein [Cytophagaceae bacterium]
MFYKKYQAASHLSPFVECFYIWENVDFEVHHQIIESPPTAFGSMVFNYGDTYSFKTLGNEKFISVPQNFITGQATQNYFLQLPRKIGMIGVVFKPAAISTLFGMPMYEFVNTRYELSDVFGTEIDIISDKIREENSKELKVEILNNYLTIKLMKLKKGPDRTDYAANLILDQKGMVNISNLMSELYVCRRQFERQFLQKVGMSPKYYARVRRIGYLCASLASKKWKIDDWHDLIYKMGYYDQSHFIKEFTSFTGKSPRFYLKNNLELANYLE